MIPVIFWGVPQGFKKKPKRVKKVVRPFYLTPNRIDNQPTVVILRNKYGVNVEGVKTLSTDYIGTQKTTMFNGSHFFLSVKGDRVYLNVITDGIISNDVHWNIEDITTIMKSKNPENRMITNQLVEDLITNGYLQVKFNVSRIKDHGTLWRCSLNSPIVVEREVSPEPVVELIETEDDFFTNL